MMPSWCFGPSWSGFWNVSGRRDSFSPAKGSSNGLEHHIGKLDLIFLDMEMGELAGTEIARRLRSANPGLHLVFVTGYADRIFGGYLAIRVRNSLVGFTSCMDSTP